MATIKELLKQNPEGKFRRPSWDKHDYIYFCFFDGRMKNRLNHYNVEVLDGSDWGMVREPVCWNVLFNKVTKQITYICDDGLSFEVTPSPNEQVMKVREVL
jgi:hypothetical protein